MSVWEALEYLNTLVDDSDPDTDLSQLDHLLQTAEQIRRDGHPRWFILTGLIHDLGKSFAFMASLSGPSSEILFRLVAPGPTGLFFINSFPITGTAKLPLSNAARRLRRRKRPGQRLYVMGPRRVPVSGRQRLPAAGSVIHDSLSLVLSAHRDGEYDT